MSKESIRNTIGLIILILTIPALIFVAGTDQNNNVNAEGDVMGIISSNYSHITPAEFNKAKNGISDTVVVDVRTPEEYSESHIENAVNIDYYAPDFLSQIANLDKNNTYLIYCRTGNRSSETIRQMQEMGFENVKGLAGGINSWATVFEVE